MKRNTLVTSLSLVALCGLGLAVGCGGSTNDTSNKDGGGGSAGSGGSGGNGGSAGSSGASGAAGGGGTTRADAAPPAPITCGANTCQPTSLMGFTAAPCCTPANTCGISPGAFGGGM